MGKWFGIRLRRALEARLQVNEGDVVDLVIEGDNVVMRARRPRYKIEELVARMEPQGEPEVLEDVDVPGGGGQFSEL